MGLAGVILAAGESTRMGRDKALLPWPPEDPSETLLSAAIGALSPFCDMVLVVAGKNEAKLRPVVDGCAGFLVVNAGAERGQFSSLQVGLQEVLNRGRDTAMVTHVDRPPPSTPTLTKLISEFEGRSRNIWAVVPEFQGKHGHPILIGREMIAAFLKAPENASAREIEHAHESKIAFVTVDDQRVTLNFNAPEDYAAAFDLP
ncbi:MAG TPA: nucleotidyltransferase family protein [Terriglobales bacterium]|nr:nucleotidyltransferase family protein [Terriglobales bacterium]